MKKLVSLVLALALVLASCAVAFAAGDNGSVTVTNAEIGAKYNLYKLFDATVAADGTTAYLLPSGKDVSSDTFFNTYFTVGTGNYITPKDTFTEAVLKTDAFKTWATDFGTHIGDEKTADSDTVSWTGLAYGYYYVTSTVGAVITVDEVNPFASVIDKNETNETSKVIVDNGKEADVNEAGINEDVHFKISDKVKNYNGTDMIYQYLIDDELDPAFTYKKDTLVVKVNDTELATTAYSVAWNDTTPAFTITIPWTADGTINSAHKYANNSVLTVTYTAFLDADKIQANPGDLHYGTDPNKNKARLRWNDDEPTIPEGDRPWDKTETFDTALTIIKVDGKGNELTGAQFTLTCTGNKNIFLVTEAKYEEDANGTYWKLKDGTYTSEAPNNNPTHDAVYDSTTTKYSLNVYQTVKGEGRTDTTVSSYVDKNGKVTFTGLTVGSYKIEETVVPAGFNKAADIEFEVTFDPDTKKFASSNANVVLNETNNVFSTTVVNNQGTELPSTGGIGTTIFYIVGGILLIGAAVILVARRKAHD